MVSARSLRPEDLVNPKPVYVVWEITLRCDHACAHCGSRAGPSARDDELSTQEMLEVADALVRMGSREVTLIGGEAYLRGDCCQLIEHMAKQGIRVTMQTGGRGLTETRVRKLKEAGLAAIGVSVDGPAHVHDVLRNSPGSFEAAMRALKNAKDIGLITTSNSQVNRLNKDHLRETAKALRDAGVLVWRAQMTAPMGAAADRPEWILQPYMILEVIDTLAAIQKEALQEAKERGINPNRAFRVALGNNMGYFGPHEQLLRSRPGQERYWQGCQAGRFVMGIESDGKIKGCPSLPTHPYIGGNVRELSLEQIWNETPELKFVRERGTSELWGYCKDCYYADICRAGCSFTAHSTLGRRGNYPFCYHRANEFRKQGQREILRHKIRAPGTPYDYGQFELDVEPWSEADFNPVLSKRTLPVLT
jgi:radical SAM protein with 4Fe4S-binding SPASM domain